MRDRGKGHADLAAGGQADGVLTGDYGVKAGDIDVIGRVRAGRIGHLGRQGPNASRGVDRLGHRGGDFKRVLDRGGVAFGLNIGQFGVIHRRDRAVLGQGNGALALGGGACAIGQFGGRVFVNVGRVLCVEQHGPQGHGPHRQNQHQCQHQPKVFRLAAHGRVLAACAKDGHRLGLIHRRGRGRDGGRDGGLVFGLIGGRVGFGGRFGRGCGGLCFDGLGGDFGHGGRGIRHRRHRRGVDGFYRLDRGGFGRFVGRIRRLWTA